MFISFTLECKDPIEQIILLLALVNQFQPDVAIWYEDSINESLVLGLDITTHVDDLYELVDSFVGYPLVSVY